MKYLEIFALFTVLAFVIGCQTETKVDVPPPSAINQASVEATKAAVDAGNVQFIDVRTADEFKAEHAVKAVNMPLDNVETEASKLDRSKPVYVICQSGRRSMLASQKLEKQGFTSIYNVEGGTNAWVKAGLPTEKP